MVELQSGFRVKCLRSDRGDEFTSCEFNKLCEEEGIQRQFSMTYTLQQNGVVERKNRIVVEMAKAMLHEKKGLPYYLWAEAVHTTVYILNRCPTRALGDKTLFKAYSKRKPRIAHFKIFGYLCYVHIPSEVRQKSDAKSTREQPDISETTSPMAPLGSHDHIQSPRLSPPYEPSGGISSNMRNT
ncbi:unnamed protein product [Prunus armeniaca]